MTSEPYIPYSQRTGAAPTPTQLQIGEVSEEFRRLLEYYLAEGFKARLESGYSGPYIPPSFEAFLKDFHVRFLKLSIGKFKCEVRVQGPLFVEQAHVRELAALFDFIEFTYRHSGTSGTLKSQLEQLFVETRSAYRLVDGLIIAVGTSEQADAISAAISKAGENEFSAARQHLINAAAKLRTEDWSGSVSESVNAVESVARRLSPEAKTLEPALRKLEELGRLHPALKQAFAKLYGYSSDEEGVRHAVVFKEVVQVDEVDALFMLGACASFVSFLIARKLGKTP